jgi:hypothetical protein
VSSTLAVAGVSIVVKFCKAAVGKVTEDWRSAGDCASKRAADANADGESCDCCVVCDDPASPPSATAADAAREGAQRNKEGTAPSRDRHWRVPEDASSHREIAHVPESDLYVPGRRRRLVHGQGLRADAEDELRDARDQDQIGGQP